MTHKETQEFSKRVLNHMRERLSDYQEEYGDLYNLEATPAESTSYRLAKHDVKAFDGKIITASGKCGTPYYTNSSHLPVGFTDDIFAALDIQDELQTLYTSGTVFHAFLGEKLPTWQSAAALVRKIAQNYKLPYYTLSPTYSICKNHGYLSGEVYTCPVCGEKTEVYSRITGYYRPIQNWNDGKAEEFRNRKVYNIGRSNELHPELHVEGDATAEQTEQAAEQSESPVSADGTEILLFATKTCPNCRVAAAYLDQAGIPYHKLLADENADLVEKYEIRQAPTLVLLKPNGIAEKIVNLSNIKKFIGDYHA